MKKYNLFNLILIMIAIIGGIVSVFLTNGHADIYSVVIRLGIIPAMLLPYLLKRFFKIKIPVTIETIYLIFIFFAYFLGSIINLYYIIYDYDKVMHFLSGILSALVAITLLIKFKKYDKKSILFNVLFMIAITLMIASLWEMYEFKTDILFNKDIQRVYLTGVNDTMLDMMSALFGAVITSLIFTYEILKNKSLFVVQFIEEIKK